MSDLTWRNETRKLSELVPWEHNPKRMTKKQAEGLRASIEHFGFAVPFLVSPDGDIYDGHQRQTLMSAIKDYGPNATVDVRVSSRALTDDERRELVVRLKQNQAGWDFDMLGNLYEREELIAWGFEPEELGLFGDDGASEATTPEQARQTLAERFLVPPFSVLDARQGYWQARKSAWIALGIQSELGRGVDIVPNGSERPPEHDGAKLRHGRANATPGGSPRDAANLGPDGKTQRGDGKGRVIRGKRAADDGGAPLPLDRTKNGKSPARKFGQDLMRGEHVVGENRLTWVSGARDRDALDDTSRKNLAAGRVGAAIRDRDKHDHEWQRQTLGHVQAPEQASGTSIFDPVLCELAYTWFCPPAGRVLDPFAGGSVRGIVAACLGRKYTGVDLRPEQVQANEAQAAAIVPDNLPAWIVGDSQDAQPAGLFDFVFSCPPYYDLEIYSKDPADLSNMEYADFLTAYRSIIAQAVARLADNRFACFVVGDVRDKRGMYRNFPGETIAAFQDAGAVLYNEAILVTAVGSLPIRVGKQFSSGRKLGKTHQNVLVFVKGDPRKATDACGIVEIGNLDEYTVTTA